MKPNPFKWLARNGGKAQFTHSATCQITGLSTDTLLNWETRGIVATERPGSGVHRKYCGHDLIVLGLARKLAHLGLGAKDSARVALRIHATLLKRLNQIRRGKIPHFGDLAMATAFISSAGPSGAKRVWIEFGQIRLPPAIVGGGEPVIVVPYGRAVSSIVGKARGHQAHEETEEKLGQWEIQRPLTTTHT